MKNDTSNTINLDNVLDLLEGKQREVFVETADQSSSSNLDWGDLLTEWSYRLPKGYPTIEEGVFVKEDELRVLNEILADKGIQSPFQIKEAVTVTAGMISSNPTDLKEAMVCLFSDALLMEPNLFDVYKNGLIPKLVDSERKSFAKTVKMYLAKAANAHGPNYGISGYKYMPDYVKQSMLDLKGRKSDIVVINNGFSAADGIIKTFGKLLKPGMVNRAEAFEAIRKRAVELINQDYNIKGYYPDNWCPGDIYFFRSGKGLDAIKAKSLNVGKNSLNSYFYGSANTQGSIIAVSLKMQLAQAGKGTTFIKNVVVDGVVPQDKVGKDLDTQQVIKFRDVKRRLDKYYLGSDNWLKDDKEFAKVKSAISFLAKATNAPLPIKPSQSQELKNYLKTNKPKVQKLVEDLNKKLSTTVDTASKFQEAYNRFVKNLKAMRIEKVEGNSRDFVKQIEQKNKQENGGKINTNKMQELMAQKAATYDLASVLIEKWTQKTKTISPAFAAHLEQVKNPFVAITMFAVAQHGLNPDFYKAVGRNNGDTGSVSEFPSNSVVDEKKSVQQLKVVDSPGQAGFYIDYLLRMNNHTYQTTLTFRFSKDQIRIEVEELKEV